MELTKERIEEISEIWDLAFDLMEIEEEHLEAFMKEVIPSLSDGWKNGLIVALVYCVRDLARAVEEELWDE